MTQKNSIEYRKRVLCAMKDMQRVTLVYSGFRGVTITIDLGNDEIATGICDLSLIYTHDGAEIRPY